MLAKGQKKSKSIYPIFSLATIIIGATVLTLPWVISRAGLVLGLCIVLVSGFLSSYSGILILKNAYGYFDFSKRCKEVLGVWSVVFAHISSIVCLCIALTAFHIFLGENMYDIVNFFIDETGNTRPNWWNLNSSGGFVAVILFCLVLIPKPTLLIKASSFAFLFVIAVCIIIVITGFTPKGGIDMSTVKYFDTGFASSIGVLSVSFFVHNLITVIFYDDEAAKDLTKLRSLSSQDKSSQIINVSAREYRPHYARDIFIAFFLDIFLYFFIGLVGYIGYHVYIDPVDGEIKTVPDNYFMVFTSTNVYALIGRVLLCTKIIICFPVVCEDYKAILYFYLFIFIFFFFYETIIIHYYFMYLFYFFFYLFPFCEVFRALRSTFLLAVFPWKWLDIGENSEVNEQKKLLKAKNKRKNKNNEIYIDYDGNEDDCLSLYVIIIIVVVVD
jgi:hypothetical protein